jgi:hypothetical protein
MRTRLSSLPIPHNVDELVIGHGQNGCIEPTTEHLSDREGACIRALGRRARLNNQTIRTGNRIVCRGINFSVLF